MFYSPKSSLQGGTPLQAFTAIGHVADDELYQVEMSHDFRPWRRNVRFSPCVQAPIAPLIDELSFIKDKRRWGYPFRFGLFEIPCTDFELISGDGGGRLIYVVCSEPATPAGRAAHARPWKPVPLSTPSFCRDPFCTRLGRVGGCSLYSLNSAKSRLSQNVVRVVWLSESFGLGGVWVGAECVSGGVAVWSGGV